MFRSINYNLTNMKSIFPILILSVFFAPASACLNEYNVNLRGETFEIYEGLPVFYRSFDKNYSSEFVKSVNLAHRDTIHFKKLSDVVVHLTKLGRFDEALGLAKWLNHKHPNEYQVVSNLGTLYEITGNLDSAYFYIHKGLKLNPDSHDGSEWVHLAILKAKKNIQQDPGWLLNNKVLNVNVTDTVETYSDQQIAIMDSIWQISFQMKERIPFTPDKDLLMASVMIELGEMLELHISIENAYVAYKIAEQYDPENILGAKRKIELLLPLFKKYGFKESVFQDHFPPESEYLKRKKSGSDKVLNDNKSAFSWSWIYTLTGIVSVLVILVIFIAIRNRRKLYSGKD